jgi:hypothetical protein
MDTKELFYSMIDRIGRDKVKGIIASNTSDAINMLISEFNSYASSIDYDEEKDNATLVTALMHYMLTECMIQSERKVTINDVMLDIVIPTTRMLRTNASNALVITIVNDTDLKVNLLESVQPNRENIWLILPHKEYANEFLDRIREYRIYTIDKYIDVLSTRVKVLRLSSIIDDIRGFLKSKGLKGLSILYG